MQVSTRAYYEWLKVPQDSDRNQQDQQVAERARQIFIDNKQCLGSRRLADRLQKQGFTLGRFKTRRIMRELKLKVRYPRRVKVTTDSKHNEAISPNRLDRQFQVAKPNQVWTTDITYVWTLLVPQSERDGSSGRRAGTADTPLASG
ncbi:IS3 family transposase [Candidatus Methylospira mobilis]|uniref:IS3 family transposase n=1 Tax=Candidatus Methylospira mobilis TaxID=1808979 RepID=UPI00387E4157